MDTDASHANWRVITGLKFDTTNVFRIEEYARAIAKVLSTKDTYITNAYTEYLKDYNFKGIQEIYQNRVDD